MHISLWNVALQTINFLVLVFLLQRFLYRPILAVIDERKRKVALEQAAAVTERQQAEQLKQEYLDKLAALEDEKQGVLQLAQKQAEVETSELRKKIESQFDELRAKQTALLDRERNEVERELRQQAVQLGLVIAERLLQDGAVVADPLSAVQTAVRKIATLSLAERERLVIELRRHGAELHVTSEVSPTQLAAIRSELAALAGVEVALTTRLEPKLRVGVELRLGHLSFALHLAGALAKVQAETLLR